MQSIFHSSIKLVSYKSKRPIPASDGDLFDPFAKCRSLLLQLSSYFMLELLLHATSGDHIKKDLFCTPVGSVSSNFDQTMVTLCNFGHFDLVSNIYLETLKRNVLRRLFLLLG